MLKRRVWFWKKLESLGDDALGMANREKTVPRRPTLTPTKKGVGATFAATESGKLHQTP